MSTPILSKKGENQSIRVWIILVFLFQFFYSFSQPYLLDGHRCDAQGDTTEWGVPTLIDGDDGQAGTSEIRNVWSTMVQDTLWFALSRESGGTATWVTFMDADCSPGTGPQDSIDEPFRYGAEIALGFEWSANSPVITGELFIWNPDAQPNGKYVSAVDLDVIGLQGELICGDNTTEGWFGEFFILIEDIIPLGFDPCSDCGSIRIPGFASLAGGDPNSATKDDAYPDALDEEIILQYNSTPEAIFSVSETDLCIGNTINIDGTISFDSFPLDDSISFSWDLSYDGVSFNVESTASTIQNYLYSTPGNYDIALIATDQFGCLDTFVQTVNVYEVPEVSCMVDQDVSCFGGNDGAASIIISAGTGPFEILWSDGQTGTSASNLVAGIYSVIVTDANLCSSDTCYLEIIEPTLIIANLSGQCSDEASNLVDVYSAPSGGSMTYTYLWSNGAVTQNLLSVPAGSYTVSITDGASCIIEEAIIQECCSLQLDCDGLQDGNFSCLFEVSDIPVEFADADLTNDLPTLEGLGIVILDSCAQITVSVLDSDNGGAGCINDTLFIFRTYTITDGVTVAECIQTFSIIDEIAPAFEILPQDTTVICSDSMLDQFNEWLNVNGNASASDSCGGVVTYNNNYDQSVTPDFTSGLPISVWFYIEDNCGNIDSAEAFFIISCINAFKAVSQAVPAASGLQGNFDMTFTFQIFNTGSTPLSEIFFEEDLLTQLGGAFISSTIPIVTNLQTDGVLPGLDASYDGGILNSDIFIGGGLLNPGEMISLDVIVEIDPDAPGAIFNVFGDLQNQATVTAENPDGTVVLDDSDDSEMPVAPEDIPEDNDEPTPFSLPAMGVAKLSSLVETTAVAGQYAVTYSFAIQNIGNVTLDQITMVDDLVTQLGPAFIQETVPVISGITGLNGAVIPTANPAYDGGVVSDSIFLMSSGGSLPMGAIIQFDMTIIVAPNAIGAPNPLLNQASVTGTDPNGDVAEDDSDAGIDPNGTNPDDPGDTGSSDDPTVTEFLPTIVCPADLTLECGDSLDTASTGTAQAFGSCSLGNTTTMTFTDISTGLTDCNGTTGQIERMWIATDLCGNSDTCFQTLTIIDTTAPVIISCPGPLTIDCDDDTSPDNTGMPIANDICDPDVSISFSDEVFGFDGSCNQNIIGSIERTFVLADACGNSISCTQTIMVQDVTGPEITFCPADTSVLCLTDLSPANLGMATATDACNTDFIISFSDELTGFDGTCVDQVLGTISRTFAAEDACGNITECIQIISLIDTIAPVITFCPADTIVDCATDISGFASISAEDNCAGDLMINVLVDSLGFDGTCVDQVIGTIVKTYSAEDACGNITECTQTIIFQDTIAPTINLCPADTIVNCDTDYTDLGMPLATDNCTGELSITSSDEMIGFDGTCTSQLVGTIMRTFVVEDACGNSSECVQMISVQDTVAPGLSFDHPLLENMMSGDTLRYQCLGQDLEWTLPEIDSSNIIITDNCAEEFVIEFEDMLDAEGDCAEDGFFLRYRCTWTVSDPCGNTSEIFFFLEIVDDIAPVLIGVPSDTAVSCDQIPVVPIVEASDDCLCAHIEFSESELDYNSCLDGQILVRTWTATDHCGNVSVAQQQIFITDETSPQMTFAGPENEIIENGSVLQFDCNSGGFPSWFSDMTEDAIVIEEGCQNLDALSINFSSENDSPANCDWKGYMEEITYTWEIEDACGNSSVFSFKGQLIDTVPPVIEGIEPVVCGSEGVNNVFAYDDCSQTILRHFDQNIDNPCGDGSAILRTYEAFDACGNYQSVQQTIYGIDVEPPAIQFVDSGLESDSQIEIGCTAQDGSLSGFDVNSVFVESDCPEGIHIDFEERIISEGDCSLQEPLYVLEVVWVATDLCGNSSEVSINVIIQDKEAPELINFKENITISCGEDIPGIMAFDDCGSVTINVIEDSTQGDCPNEEIIKRTIQVSDACGNMLEAKQIVNVVDDQGPKFPDVEDVICGDDSMPKIMTRDACTNEEIEALLKEELIINQACGEGYTIERLWTAEDACGNVSEFLQHIIMQDTVPPIIDLREYKIMELFDAGLVTLYQSSATDMQYLDYINAESFYAHDGCNEEIEINFIKEIKQLTCVEGVVAEHYYLWEVSDLCGNISSVEIHIQIVDDLPPVMSDVPNDTVIICGIIPEVQNPSVFDLSGDAMIEFFETEKQIESGMIITRTWIATDNCGNSVEEIQVIEYYETVDLSCELVLPNPAFCNSHDNVLYVEATGGAGPYTYNWKVIAGICNINATSSPDTVTFYQGFTDIEIGVEVIDQNGCTTYCTIEIECEGKDSKSQNASFAQAFGSSELSSELTVYPNPVQDLLHVQINSELSKSGTVSIFNDLGQLMMNKDVVVGKGTQTFEMPMQRLVNGMYYIVFQSAGSYEVSKIVKE